MIKRKTHKGGVQPQDGARRNAQHNTLAYIKRGPDGASNDPLGSTFLMTYAVYVHLSRRGYQRSITVSHGAALRCR